MCFLLFPLFCSVCWIPPICDCCFNLCYRSLGGPIDKECAERAKEERRLLQYQKEQCRIALEEKRIAEKEQLEEDIRECRRIKELMKIREREIVEAARKQRLREKRQRELEDLAKEYEQAMKDLEEACKEEDEEM